MAGEKTTVGNEIRRWRHTRQLTLAQVAQGSGLNVGYLSQIENCKAVPSLEALLGIARALDVPPAWLLVDATPPPRVVRATERPVIADGVGGNATEVDGGTLSAVLPPLSWNVLRLVPAG